MRNIVINGLRYGLKALLAAGHWQWARRRSISHGIGFFLKGEKMEAVILPLAKWNVPVRFNRELDGLKENVGIDVATSSSCFAGCF